MEMKNYLKKTGEEEASLLLILGILLFVVASEASAQYCVKSCRVHQKMHFFFLAVFFYSLVCVGLYNLYCFRDMGMVNLMWSCISIITIITVGIIFFHETITKWDVLGIIFVFVGFSLVFIKGHKKS